MSVYMTLGCFTSLTSNYSQQQLGEKENSPVSLMSEKQYDANSGCRSLAFIVVNKLAFVLVSAHTILSYENQVCKVSDHTCEAKLSHLMQNVYAK